MEHKKINTYHADKSDIEQEDVGPYHPYNGIPTKVGDKVVLEIYPNVDDPVWKNKYVDIDEIPPDYLVLAEVTMFEDEWFYCKIIME